MWFSPPLFWDRACPRLCRMGFWELAGPSVNRFCVSSYLLTVSCEEHPRSARAGTGRELPSPDTVTALSVTEKLPHKEYHFSSLNSSFPSVLLLANQAHGLVSFWKLFGNKKQTQSGVVRWGCDLSPPETWVPSLSRGWWSLPSHHRLVFNVTQPHGIWERHYIDPRMDSAAQRRSIGLWGAMRHSPVPPIVSDLVLTVLTSVTSSFVENSS